MMKKVIAFVLAIFPALFFSVSEAKPHSGNKSLTVMSYNIRYGSAEDGPNSWDIRKPATVSMIKDQAPDVMGVQEAFSFQIEYITENCPDYGFVGISRLDPKDAETPAIFYDRTSVELLDWGNFWLSETPDRVSFGWDAACERNATWALMRHRKSGREFYFVNTHLDHVGKTARAEGLEMVTETIASMNTEGLPVILTGDFNALADDPAIKALEGRMLNARYAAKESSDAYGTYNGWGGSNTAIDYIFFTGFRKCTVYETVRKQYDGVEYISDHYPVKAVLVF